MNRIQKLKQAFAQKAERRYNDPNAQEDRTVLILLMVMFIGMAIGMIAGLIKPFH